MKSLTRRALVCLILLFLATSLTLVWWGQRGGTSGAAVVLVWTFEASERGAVVASPAVAGDVLFVACVRDLGLTTGGAVHCLDRTTGKVRWSFDDGRKMLHTISTPLVQDGRIYFGEGMHGDLPCKLHALEAGSGQKVWDFSAWGHIESGPIAQPELPGLLYLTAGDEGLHAVDRMTGQPRWNYRGSGHIDAAPHLVQDRLYGGSAVSRQHRLFEAFCLEAQTGKPIWRVPVALPVWGSSVLADGQLFVPIGNGRLSESEPPPGKPAGGLLCLSPGDGHTVWSHPVPDSVLGRPALDADRVYFGSRDGHCRAVERGTGKLVWKYDVGSPVVAGVTLERGRVHVVGSAGQVVCLDATMGTRLWSFDVQTRAPSTQPRLWSSPCVVVERNGRIRLYLGAELRSPAGNAAVVYCLEET